MADGDDNDGSLDAAMAAFAKHDEEQAEPSANATEPGQDDDTKGIDVPDEEEDNVEQEGDEPTETDEQDDEPVEPVIDPPARWTTDQQKMFASLPRDAQQVIAASMRDQERAIGAKSEETATARRQAEEATGNAVNLHRQYAQELDRYAQAFTPQRPDYSLLATDPQAYAQQQAMYEAGLAQSQDMAQRAQFARQQAEAIDKAAQDKAIAEDWQDLLKDMPEMGDPEKQAARYREWMPTVEALGIPNELRQGMNSLDHKMLSKAHEWKTKADKWDKAQASNMQRVRAAKDAPKVMTPGAAQPKGSERARGFKYSMDRLRQSGDVRDAAAAFARLPGR